MNFKALGIGLFFFLYYVTLSAGTDPPPPPGTPGEEEFPIPGILLFVVGAVFFGVYKKIKQPKK